MDTRHHAAVVKRSFALALVLAAGCSHLPPLTRSRDVLDSQEHVRLGSSYEAQGMRAEAAAQYDAAVKRDPKFAEGWVALGNMAFIDGRLADAESSFRRAVGAAPKNAAACNNLAMAILARDGDLAEAEVFARTALEQPGNLKPYILDTLANIHLKRRRFADALDLIGQADAAAPPEAVLVRAQLKATRDAILAAEAK